jgi:TRAP-type C4-dicarboxylate transport system permease small subunit
VQIIAVLVVVMMSLVLVRYGIAIADISWFQTSPTMEWSMGYLYLIVPASGVIMTLFALEHLINVLRGGSLAAQTTHEAPIPGHSLPAGQDEKGSDQWP